MQPKTIPCEDLAVGMSHSLTNRITLADIQQFAEVSGDFNPLHLDEEFAATTRFGQRIAHGMLSASFISTIIGTQLPGLGTIYISQTINFKAPVFIDDEVITTVEVIEFNREKSRATLACVCKVGDKVVIEGEAKVLVPRSS